MDFWLNCVRTHTQVETRRLVECCFRHRWKHAGLSWALGWGKEATDIVSGNPINCCIYYLVHILLQKSNPLPCCVTPEIYTPSECSFQTLAAHFCSFPGLHPVICPSLCHFSIIFPELATFCLTHSKTNHCKSKQVVSCTSHPCVLPPHFTQVWFRAVTPEQQWASTLHL